MDSFKDLLHNIRHHGIDLWLQIQIFYDHVSYHLKCEIDHAAGGKLRDKIAEELWEIIEDLALYDNESWNDPRDSAAPDDHMKLDQFTQFRFHSLTEEEGWIRIEEYIQYHDDLWDEPSPSMNVSSISEAIKPTLKGRLKRASIDKSKTPEPKAPTLAITARSGISTRDPPFPTPPRPATNSFTEGETEKPKGTKKSSTQEPVPRPSILYQPLKTSYPPFPSRLKKQKKDDEDECLLSVFKQIQINLPFLEAMIHMPKGAKVLKDLLSHKEKLEKAASLVKLNVECPAIIQKSLPQKEGDLGSFTLPCLIGPLAVKNALADIGASINLMPHSLF
ncbi:hypothetical protein Tco_0110427 [Tanacetum coccineum]